MTTSIEQSLLNAAHNGNLAKVETIVKALTKAQVNSFDPSTFNAVLLDIASYSYTKPYNSSEAARTFMEKLGGHVDSDTIGQAMDTFAQNGNFSGVDSITDHLTADSKFGLSLNGLTGTTLQDISTWTFSPDGKDHDAAAAAAARDLMSKLSAQTDSDSIGIAMDNFAQDGNFAGVKNTTDFLTEDNKFGLNLNGLAGSTLQDISTWTFSPDGKDHDAAAAAAAHDLMSKLSAQTDSDSIGIAMDNFAQDGNFAGVKATSDYLTADNKFGLMNGLAGNTFRFISFRRRLGWRGFMVRRSRCALPPAIGRCRINLTMAVSSNNGHQMLYSSQLPVGNWFSAATGKRR